MTLLDQTCRNDARKQWNKDVSSLQEALNRLVLVLSLLSCLVVLSRGTTSSSDASPAATL